MKKLSINSLCYQIITYHYSIYEFILKRENNYNSKLNNPKFADISYQPIKSIKNEEHPPGRRQ
jgi:hypothetical protein